MKEIKGIVILITTGSEGEGRKIAELLVKEKKAACVNIVPRVDSLFWWEDELDSAQENLLIIKTKATQFSEIVEMVKKVHSYDVPEIIALPIINGNEDYLTWLETSIEQ